MAKRQRKRRRSVAQPGPAPSEESSRRRPLATMAALVGASGLLATVTGLVVTRSFDPFTDRAADLVGSSALVVYHDTDLEALPGAAFAFDHPLPAAARTGSGAVSARLYREGAIPIGWSKSAVTIENKRKETAVITSIEAKVRKRADVPTAALVVVPGSGGSGEGPVELHFDLDAVDLDARTLDKRGRMAGKYLDEKGLTLEAGEKLRFNLIGRSATAMVDWAVQFDYVMGGETRVLDVAAEGQALRVTGAGRSYREAYVWDPDGLTPEPIKEICPVDCRRSLAEMVK